MSPQALGCAAPGACCEINCRHQTGNFFPCNILRAPAGSLRPSCPAGARSRARSRTRGRARPSKSKEQSKTSAAASSRPLPALFLLSSRSLPALFPRSPLPSSHPLTALFLLLSLRPLPAHVSPCSRQGLSPSLFPSVLLQKQHRSTLPPLFPRRSRFCACQERSRTHQTLTLAIGERQGGEGD